jgi:hypothetical protein
LVTAQWPEFPSGSCGISPFFFLRFQWETASGDPLALTGGEAAPRESSAEREQEREQEEAERLAHLKTFKFKTYFPKKFRQLREMFNIDISGDDGTNSLLHQAMAEYKTGSFTGIRCTEPSF